MIKLEPPKMHFLRVGAYFGGEKTEVGSGLMRRLEPLRALSPRKSSGWLVELIKLKRLAQILAWRLTQDP